VRRRAFRDRFGEQSAQKRTVHLHHVRKIEIEHVANGLLHDRMIAADVKDAVAAQEIQIRLVIHIVEIRALRPGVDLVETDDALGRDERAVNVPFVQLVVFAEARGDDFLQIKSHGEIVRDVSTQRNCYGSQS
jgi:hypothetical protein